LGVGISHTEAQIGRKGIRKSRHTKTLYISVSQPPDRGPVPDPGINYTGPQKVLLEFVFLSF